MWWWNCVYHFLLLSIARQISCSFVRLFLLRFHEILGFEKRPMPPIDTWKLWPWFFSPYYSATLSGQDRRHFIAVAVNYWFQIHGDEFHKSVYGIIRTILKAMMKIELQNQNDKKYVPNKETTNSLSVPKNQKIQLDTSIADLFDNYLRKLFNQD